MEAPVSDHVEQELRRRLQTADADPDPRWVTRLRDDLVADWHGDRPVAIAPVERAGPRRSRLTAAVAATLVAASMLTLFLMPRGGRRDPGPPLGEPGPPPLVDVEVPTPVVDGDTVTIETSLGRLVWTRVTAPFGPVASSPDGLFSLYSDALGLRIRRYEAESGSWLDIAPIEGRDRWTGLGRVVSDHDLYFFSIDASCADLALGDGGLAPSPGAERCLALERSDDGGLTFPRSALDMPDAFVPRAARVISSGQVSLLDAIGTGTGDHRYWASTDGRTWSMVELPWSNDGRAAATDAGSIITDDAGFIAYATDGSAAWRSDDGATWTPVTDLSGLPTGPDGVTMARAADSLLAIAGGTVYRSSDGTVWDVVGVFPDVAAPGSSVSTFGLGLVTSSADISDCVELDRASIRVTTHGSTWFEVFGAATRSDMYPATRAGSGDDHLCIQVATDTIIVESSAGTWLGQLDEPNS